MMNKLEGSGFVLNGIVNVILEIYKVNDNKASSWVELPSKNKISQSIMNKKIMINYVFYSVS